VKSHRYAVTPPSHPEVTSSMIGASVTSNVAASRTSGEASCEGAASDSNA